MAEWSGFFDAHKLGESWDRVYLAEDFAKFFSPLIGNGVFAGRSNELQVFQSVPADMSVIISSGQSWIDGYGYLNDSDLTIPIDPADGSLGRIDRIVNQWSAVDRQIRTVWKKGTPAVKPVAPPLLWDADYKELNLCTLSITAGLSSITQDNIRDTRADSSVCGWVTGLIDQVDTSTLFAQWDAAYEKAFAQTGDYLKAQKAAWEEFFRSVSQDLGIPVPSLEDAGSLMMVNAYGSGYELNPLDNSLTLPGRAADSRTTGAEIRKAAPRNLLDNSDFTNLVAQAGIGGKHGTVTYAADRWILDSGTVSYEAGVGLTLNGAISQKLELPPARDTSAFVGTTSGSASISYADGKLTITSSGGVLNWAALYSGVYTDGTMPSYQPRGFAAELLECQRFFYHVPGDLSICYPGYVYSTNQARVTIPTPIVMRATPSIKIDAVGNLNLYDGKSNNVTEVSIIQWDGNAIGLKCTGTYRSPGSAASMRFNTSVQLIADL